MGYLLMSVDRAQPVGVSLLDRVESYLLKHKITASWFGWLATGSPSLVARMRSGMRMRQATIANVEAQLGREPLIQRSRRATRGQVMASRYAQTVKENRERDQEERQRRLNDPIEQAATYLRRQGWMVVKARVIDENAQGWAVGRLRLDDAGLLQRARDKGWEG